jgi:hypothetical protein
VDLSGRHGIEAAFIEWMAASQTTQGEETATTDAMTIDGL